MVSGTSTERFGSQLVRVSDESAGFVHNMRLPVHGWFRFSAGFSAIWARDLILNAKEERGSLTVLDPFAGVGTAILASEEAGVSAIGFEAQPFIARVAKAKLLWHTSIREFTALAEHVISEGRFLRHTVSSYPKLIYKCYTSDSLQALHNLKIAWEEANDGEPASELIWLAIVSILRECSRAGTAPWTYVLPRKTKARVHEPFEAFSAQVARMATDMRLRQSQGIQPNGKVIERDAREGGGIENNTIDLVVTSPPYANNYDYADATRLELSFLGGVSGWGDLQKYRTHLVRSSSQHVSIERDTVPGFLNQLSRTLIYDDLGEVCEQLSRERLKHGGKKDYHIMIAGYFADMNRVFKSMRTACKKGAVLCFVVGDSAPYAIHVPVEKWLGELAVYNGFKSFWFQKTRDRNVKWRNRKHRVPLLEGQLWIEG